MPNAEPPIDKTQSIRLRLIKWLTYPVLSTLMRMRVFCVAMVVLLGIQVLLAKANIHLVRCYLLEHTGTPCPGCGLTRSAIAAARFDVEAVLYYNAFGPLALIAMGLMLLGAVLPVRPRDRLIGLVQCIECRIGVTNFCFLALWVYWLARLAILGRDFAERLSFTSI